MTSEEVKIGQEDFIGLFSDVLSRMIVKMQEVDDWCVQATQDITKQDLTLIGFMGGNEGDTIMRDIANYLDVPFSTATGIVEKLVQKGYLRRYNSEDDRRIVLVGLTKKGLETFDLVTTKKREISLRVMDALEEQERSSLIRLFEKITTSL